MGAVLDDDDEVGNDADDRAAQTPVAARVGACVVPSSGVATVGVPTVFGLWT